MTEITGVWIDEYEEIAERDCCYRGAMVFYPGGKYDLTYFNCLEGTEKIWSLQAMSCNTSYRMFGELERLL